MRFSVILPVAGLVLFAVVTVRSAKVNEHDAAHPRKYYWWSSLRLDTDPRKQRSTEAQPAKPCGAQEKGCSQFNAGDLYVSPNGVDKALVFSGLPAFLVGAGIVALCSKQGVDELLAFMVSMPVLLFGWYFFAGWLMDRLIGYGLRRRRERRDVPLRIT